MTSGNAMSGERQGGESTYNVTMRRVRVTIDNVEK